ncbi:hypothetical protein [Sorangium sp. So ce233]|uniref:hypothetical protein n=1 Tax=Sorangium sp. So ce233 TaxID=3133290 RepID=UPI003F63A5C9
MVDLPGVAPLSPLTIILAACVGLAWALTRGGRGRPRWPFYRPVALLLTWTLATWLARGALQAWILQPTRAALGPELPYDGPARIAYFGELALRISWHFALLAAAVAVFLRRRAWWAAAAWVAVSAVLCWAYPGIRGENQARVEAIIGTIALLGSGWAMWRGYRAAVLPVPSHGAMGWILATHLAIVVAVEWGQNPRADWSAARLVTGVGFLGLLQYQVRKLRGQRGRTSPPDRESPTSAR